jgi:hypothetical protein
MRYHFLYKEKTEDIYSKGINIYAPNIFDAIFKFNELHSEVILLAIFTDNLKK